MIAFANADEFLAWHGRLKGREAAALLDREGGQLFFQGNLREAEKLFMKAMELNPKLAAAHGNMGHVLQQRGMYAQAVPWLEKALSLDPFLEGVPEALEDCRKAAAEKARQVSDDEVRALRALGISFSEKRSLTKEDPNGRLGPVEFTHEKYECSSVEGALEFLKQRGPITQNYYYVEVKTPRGLTGRDIEGIYKDWEERGRST